MKILVLGGTRFFGIHMVEELLEKGHEITIATRGKTFDDFGNRVKRIVFERTNEGSVKNLLGGVKYDVVIDKIAYCSNDIKYVLEHVDCNKYIYMSSTSVYNPKHLNIIESDFDAVSGDLVWCDRVDYPYEEVKRQAEYALWQTYFDKNWIAVRYPFVIGKDDYTNRLFFYVEHIIKGIPMNIDNLDNQMSFIRSDEAGKLMAFLVDCDIREAVNGSATGTISIKEIINYVEKKTQMKAIIDRNEMKAPYNGEVEYSINTDKAKMLGFKFSTLKDWIYNLLDYYIDTIK